MTQWLLIAAVFVWLLALVWVIQDAIISFPRSTLLGWAALTLLLGPFAIPFYLSERMTRRAEMNKLGHGRTAFPAPESRRPFRGAGMRRFEELSTPGSGIFAVVRRPLGKGANAQQSIEIPASGTLVIRRAVPGESSRAGVLVLHDDAVSRQEHCRLMLRDGVLVLEDHSRWGTTVDGKRVRGGTVEVSPGSVIKIGKSVVVLQTAGHAEIKDKG